LTLVGAGAGSGSGCRSETVCSARVLPGQTSYADAGLGSLFTLGKGMHKLQHLLPGWLSAGLCGLLSTLPLNACSAMYACILMIA